MIPEQRLRNVDSDLTKDTFNAEYFHKEETEITKVTFPLPSKSIQILNQIKVLPEL